MAPTLFEKAESERIVIQSKLTLIETQVNSHATTPLTELEVDQYLILADQAQKDVEDNFKQLQICAPKGQDMSSYQVEYGKMAIQAIKAHAKFHGIKAQFPVSGKSGSSSSSTTQSIKLPRLELPKLSGDLQEWISFRDLFTTAVHQTSMSNVEKLTQLKTLLTGEALRQIRSIYLTDTNYDIAWKSLQDRYENPRELMFSILRRLFSLQPIQGASAPSVRSLIDTTKECLRSLDTLSIPTEHWDAVILYLLFTKLDSPSRELWEQSLPDTSIPDLTRMYEFLEQRARALAAGVSQHQRTSQNQQQRNQERKVQVHHALPGNQSKCKVGCDTFHPIFKCPIFQRNSPPQRLEVLKKNSMCFNCFNDKHSAQSCNNQHTCKVCKKRHHTMIHDAVTYDKENRFTPTQASGTPHSAPTFMNGHTRATHDIQPALLATASVRVTSKLGELRKYRAFLDNGSAVSLITESAARKLKLFLYPTSIPITGLSSSQVTVATHITSIIVTSHFDSTVSYPVTVLVVSNISSNFPSEKCDTTQWHHIRDLQLADPKFAYPAPVDLLLGSDIFWESLGGEKRKGHEGQPLAIKSSLGWLVAGKHSSNSPVTTFITNAQLDAALQKFWEQEEMTSSPVRSEEEDQCEKHFSDTHRRDQHGRFVVSIPWKLPVSSLGDSRRHAVQRFLSLENRLVHQKGVKDAEKIRKLSDHWESYKKFMVEYEQLGHMTRVPTILQSSTPVYYIPHHHVLKESSTTTKLRVVFDASAPTSNGTSLNSCMMVGPQLQDNLTDIMLRFRTHLIAFSADLEKMYRQIVVRPEDRDLQRILWRADPSKPIEKFQLNTVTYGTASAPYLAVRCLQQLARDEESRFPLAAPKALRDFYVDDLLSGANSLPEAKKVVTQLIELSKSGKLSLRKWTSNSFELLMSIPDDLRETSTSIPLQLDESPSIKTLGVSWNPGNDDYHFQLSLPDECNSPYTKRTVLSEIAKIFDPCGWLAPSIITCKIFMQELWKIQLKWDEKLPANICSKWEELKSSLKHVEGIRIPRYVISDRPDKMLICGFSDASEKAISACVYLASTYSNRPPSAFLLSSKTKVAPLKTTTLPRLELNGARLLSELISSTQSALHLPIQGVRAYTDSTITLCWIQGDPSRWKPYVRNRVQTIHNNVPHAKWFHIPGERNPADCASRGIPASELASHPLWWHGVPEMFENQQHLPVPEFADLGAIELEEKPVPCHATVPVIPDIFTRFSSFHRLQRVVSWLFRFTGNCRRKQNKEALHLHPLTSCELQSAHSRIIRELHAVHFHDDIESLKVTKSLPAKSKLTSLHPFLSPDGLLRVGGRIRNANIPYDKKFPILLPRNHHITISIISDIHLRYLHTGPTSTIGILNQRYWIIRVRDAVRMVIKKCVRCTRFSADTMQQIMGDLPFHRVNPTRPFSKVGVDYAGPLQTRSPGRSKIVFKCWLAIFVCFSTRAIHIEVVSELSTNAFIAALRRFISRRGPPSDIFSDCGTNFKGAEKVLRQFADIVKDQLVSDELSTLGVTFHFNPAGAPHFGGLWEAGVRSVKHHLVRVVGQTLLTYEEMLTLVCQIEAILNSQPITPASTDPSDLEALTPAHFLIGGRMNELPNPSLTDIKDNHLDRWQRIQQKQQHFWKRWSSEFLTRLQQRPKWAKTQEELQIGNMVLVKDERFSPMKWRLGRVLAVHPGKDGHIRVATINPQPFNKNPYCQAGVKTFNGLAPGGRA